MTTRVLDALLSAVTSHGTPEAPWLSLVFHTTSPRAPVDEIADRVDLGPELTLESATGMARVLRLLRAARVAAPGDARSLLGDPKGTLALLERAIGVPLVLEVRPRSTLRFRIWTEDGIEDVDAVAEVIETADAFLVRLQTGALPVRIPRDAVLRHESTRERWFEVLSIDRPEPRPRR